MYMKMQWHIVQVIEKIFSLLGEISGFEIIFRCTVHVQCLDLFQLL